MTHPPTTNVWLPLPRSLVAPTVTAYTSPVVPVPSARVGVFVLAFHTPLYVIPPNVCHDASPAESEVRTLLAPAPVGSVSVPEMVALPTNCAAYFVVPNAGAST